MVHGQALSVQTPAVQNLIEDSNFKQVAFHEQILSPMTPKIGLHTLYSDVFIVVFDRLINAVFSVISKRCRREGRP